MTQANDLDAALRAVESIAPAEREILFDEVIYLKFCTARRLRAQDLRYIARKYVRRSSFRKRLEAEFERFLGVLDAYLPSWDDLQGYPWNTMLPWDEFKKQACRSLVEFGHPIGPRGRLFVWNPDIYAFRAKSIDATFEPCLRTAEDAFRRMRRVPEIGRQWRAESALFDLVRARFPDAIAQWSPWWLGRQSVDIYVPSLNAAFEYQGEQHYRAIAFFGGEEGLAETMRRDQQKRARLFRHGIALIEWHYDRPINRQELDKVLQTLEPPPV